VDPDRARELVAAERARIERLLARRAHVDGDELSEDAAGPGTDVYQDDFDSSLGDALRNELETVERAEARLEAGTYGYSIASGKPIPDERLEAIPTAELTVAEERERLR